MRLFKRKSRPRWNDIRRPLIENNNNNIPCEHHQAGNENPSAQDMFNTHTEQPLQSEEEIPPQPLAERLGLTPDACISEDQKENVSHLIQRSVSQHFPKPPADLNLNLNQNLQQHLLNVQETFHNERLKMGPQRTSTELECLIVIYHIKTFHHLMDLLQNISSSQNIFVLMKWVLHTYLSQDLLGHPELKEMDPIKKVDLLLLTEWAQKAKNKLLEKVQKEVRESLENILQIERRQEGCDCEEAYVQLYVDTIQCVEAKPKEAKKISLKVYFLVQKVCFQELLTFLKRYTVEQAKILGEKAKINAPETIYFFKTLKTCIELKRFVQTKRKHIKRSLCNEIVATLENMEDFTLKLLLDVVSEIAEIHLAKYFKSRNKHFFFLIDIVKMHFPKLSYCKDVLKIVMDGVYNIIAHIYLKYLVQSRQSKLKSCWNPNVGQTVTEDAELLHYTILDLAPGVRQWNFTLLKVPELLECRDTEAVKIIVAVMQHACPTWSDNLQLLPALLRFKGLSWGQVKEVLDALPGQRPVSIFWFYFFNCW
ncbi:exocyst complex component 3 isoform X2 [Micropterus dolomieu]|uniref:exocyst complex component 3 isoform X2 n=1 Tax=Micropterus dolomieu TaxID=147949 RepID=UPI001E8E5A64|nr:exocyst complex component 3 isoform X2 [Micropterus dolomieu]